MNTLIRAFIASLISLLLAGALSAEVRTWTSANGSSTFEGNLLAYDAASGKVTVDRGGNSMTFHQSKLSEADIDYLKVEGTKLPDASPATTGKASTSTVDVSLPDILPDPDGKEADMSKPVQVFLIMGQSNTLEMGKVDILKTACDAGQYPYLVDDAGSWTTRKDVRNVSLMHKNGNMDVYRNDWLTISGNKIGIEVGIGHALGTAIDAPVMVLKSSIGNRSLGWDLLPPSIKAYDFQGNLQPGHGETPETAGQGPTKPAGSWYAGKQWDDDVGNAQKVLADLNTYYPGGKGYELAGVLWWQGDKDFRNAAHFNNYEKHLVALIKDLRKTFNAPNAAFVTASLGQTKESDTSSGHGVILQAMKSVASGKYSDELGDNIGFVYTNPLSKGSSSSAHYGGNAETYMNVGEAMGKEMVKQLSGK